ncbi:MAG TPA: hypothetical protein VIY98_13410 [Nitrososphaeraceae archaeon]
MTSVATCNTEDVILRGYVTADQINILLSFFVFPSIDGNQYSVTALGINQCDCIPTPTSAILFYF